MAKHDRRPARLSVPSIAATSDGGLQAAHDYLNGAVATGRLAGGGVEDVGRVNAVVMFARSVPLGLLLGQLAWSAAVVGVGFVLGRRAGKDDTLVTDFWQSRLNVPASVTYGVGWALFVLLAFFIREATSRNRLATTSVHELGMHIKYFMRAVVYNYPAGTWHPGDIDRIARHLAAYPVALKISLRGERDSALAQLTPLLHPDDASDAANADCIHAHCARVVRAYLYAGDERLPAGFRFADATRTPSGVGMRFGLTKYVDALDFTAQQAMSIAEFRPSIAYVNHLRIFLYIWMMFLPLAILKTSGWFTVLWAVLITHGIGMLFNIAMELNDPYGFDVNDVKLNQICAQSAGDILAVYTGDSVARGYLVDTDHDTPEWLEAYATGKNCDVSVGVVERQSNVGSRVWAEVVKIAPPFVLFLGWSCFIVFLTWGLADDQQPGSTTRWWSVYLPLATSTASYVSISIFLLLGFWMNDSYGRYWRALEVWQSRIPPLVADLGMNLLLSMRAGMWHERDHERFLSHLAAIPYVAKAHLREERDFSNSVELERMLSPKDLLKLNAAPHPVEYMFSVLNAYIYSADAATDLKRNTDEAPCDNAYLMIMYNIQYYEYALKECELLKDIPTPRAFTAHLHLCVTFWLALLPLTLVIHDGFLSFLYLVPIGYSIIKLLTVGREMSDPFGYDDHDLPMDTFCAELKRQVATLYCDSRGGFPDFVKDTGYARGTFLPSVNTDPNSAAHDDGISVQQIQKQQQQGPTLRQSFVNILHNFPSVSPLPVAASLLWSIAAVFGSRYLSLLWEEPVRNKCSKWCSPIDVDGAVLANVGIALFMILGFRASDALDRYSRGAEILHDLRLRVRDLALDFVMFYEDGEFHQAFKERLVAHIVQIPLCFRNMMLGEELGVTNDTLLNEEDYARYYNAASPMEYLLQTIGAYTTLQDCSFLSEYMDAGRQGHSSLIFCEHVQTLRENIAKAQAVKRFPVIKSYTSHQYKFTALWLLLLPLSMISETGYFTILWSPIISYCILCLESIAVKLVDPYGTDAIDLPVDEICRAAVGETLEAVRGADWGVRALSRASPIQASPTVGSELEAGMVHPEHTLAHLAHNSGSDLDKELKFDGLHTPKPKPSLYAHLLQSVPWWSLLIIAAWTAVGCIISYLYRYREDDPTYRWWHSRLSVTTDVGTNISFVTFTLLGFYVQKAFELYSTAGDIWGNQLPKYTQLVTSYFLNFVDEGALHGGDHERLIGHVAALSLLLKHELRDSRDVREVKGLLSDADVGHILGAPSMTRQCLDVILCYWNAYLRKDMSAKFSMAQFGTRTKMCRSALMKLELAVNTAIFVKMYPVSPGFTTVLNSLMGLFFLVLPFILAPLSGWFTILWATIVAYGVMGMYKVAGELQNPYGTDLNDLDLDVMADDVVSRILYTYREQHEGYTALIDEKTGSTPFWTAKAEGTWDPNVYNELDSMSPRQRAQHSVVLALQAVPFWILALTAVWAAVAVTIAFLVSKYLPQTGGNGDCPLWFCSAVSIESSVSSYVGFALFLLLGLFLYDSHWRFVHGMKLWRDELTGKMRTAVNFLFQAYHAGYWHRDDLERIAGHLGASVMCLKNELQGVSGEETEQQLSKILSVDDVARVRQAPDKVMYCLDVVRSYLTYSEQTDPKLKAMEPVKGAQNFYIGLRTMLLADPMLQCRGIVSIPLPFGYVQHLRIFLTIWIMLLPLGLVQLTGWISVLWVPIISYGILGIERWAEKLSDPFGTDVTDLPLDVMTEEILEMIRANLQLFEKGVENFVRRDRMCGTEEQGGVEKAASGINGINSNEPLSVSV